MKAKDKVIYAISIVVWVLIWHLTAKFIDNAIFLPEPTQVITVLFADLMPSAQFWTSIFNTVMHILQGFLIGMITGVIFAIVSALNNVIKAFFWLPIKVIKSVPVASFVILTLLWFDAEQLSVVISAMIVLPTLYINVLTGIEQTNVKLLDMARVFRVPMKKRIFKIYIPGIIPYILSACSLAIGMAWKAGVAAEIIGMTKYSIGNELYKSKIYLMIPELFAWTIVIILLSVVCEWLIKCIIKFLEGDNGKNRDKKY